MFLRIHFIGIRGKNNNGDIAIDDISFDENNCNIKPIDAVYQSTSTVITTTVQIPASDEVTCNFDQKNTCGWINDVTSKLKWTLNKGSTSSVDTGLFLFTTRLLKFFCLIFLLNYL